MRHVLPMGAEPYTVSVQELDDALALVMRCNREQMRAVLDDEDAHVRDIARQFTDAAVAAYQQLRADAEPEIIAAHKRHRESIKAA